MKKLLATVIAVGLVAQQAQTDIILAWDMSGDASPATLLAESVDASLDTTAGLNELTRTTLNNPSGANSFNGNGWNITDTFAESSDYFSFSLSPGAGQTLSLTTLQYVHNGSGTGPNNGRWGYSVNGGTFTLQSPFTIPSALPSTPSEWDFVDFQVTESDTVEFRFWAYGATSIAGGAAAAGGSVRIGNATTAGNDLVLNGSVVPEPGSLAFMGLGALGFWAFSRRRRA